MFNRRSTPFAFIGGGALLFFAVLATIVWFSVSEKKSEAAASSWPLVDGQLLPTGVNEGDELVGQLRNLGVYEMPWNEDPASTIIARAHSEPLFAITLAQELGGEASRQVAFWGLDGLWSERWTDAGDSFLKLLDGEVRERFLGYADALPAGKVVVTMANAERDAVRLTFASDELVNVGTMVVFRTECGEVAVDVRGNLYTPCDCGRFKTRRPPPPTTPPTTSPPTTTGGKDAGDKPPQDPVVTCPSGQFADRDTGVCTPYSATTTTVYDNSGGDSGPGAPGPGVTTPTTDPAPDPTVPTNTGPGDGSIPDPGV